MAFDTFMQNSQNLCKTVKPLKTLGFVLIERRNLQKILQKIFESNFEFFGCKKRSKSQKNFISNFDKFCHKHGVENRSKPHFKWKINVDKYVDMWIFRNVFSEKIK